MSPRHRWLGGGGLLALVCLCVGFAWVPQVTSALPGGPSYLVGSQKQLKPLPLYAKDHRDPWNQIFFQLFTRQISTRASADFRDAGPFVPWKSPLFRQVKRLSKRVFTRIESGDQAILPLYKGRISVNPPGGSVDVITTSRYQKLLRALASMMVFQHKRPALHRAVMQADLWAAFDRLSVWRAKTPQHQYRRMILLRFLAYGIKAISLTPKEIRALPNNYESARKQHKLPDLFGPKSGWLEVRWMPRFHDKHFGKRMASRLFYLPLRPQRNPKAFLERLRRTRQPMDRAKLLKAVALLVQPMLIDRSGRIAPTRLTYSLQIRHLTGARRGLAKRFQVFEIQRQTLLQQQGSSGLKRHSPKHPVYLNQGGNDYSFTQTHSLGNAAPTAVLIPMRKRCAGCHGDDLGSVLSLSIHHSARKPLRLLPKQGYIHALFLRKQKQKQKDFKQLQKLYGVWGRWKRE